VSWLLLSSANGQSLSRIFGQNHSPPEDHLLQPGAGCTGHYLDGLIGDLPRHGLFVGETRLLSRYRYFVDGKTLQTVAVSNVEQHSWLGYYISPAPGTKWKQDTGSGEMEESSEETIELKVSRTVGLGIHEDIRFHKFYAATSGIHIRD
jgi:hypothetical protein